MHTKKAICINEEVVIDLSQGISSEKTAHSSPNVTALDDLIDITADELEGEFEKIEQLLSGFVGVDLFCGRSIEAGKNYDWDELDHIEKGIEPASTF
jgi:hypothetical protein